MAPLFSDGVPPVTNQTGFWRCTKWWNLVCTLSELNIAKLILEVVLKKFHVVTGGTLKRTLLEEFLDDFLDSLNLIPGLQTSARRVACKSGCSKLQNVWRRVASAIVISLLTKVRAVYDLLLPRKRIVSAHNWERKSVEVQICENAEEKEEFLSVCLRRNRSVVESSAVDATGTEWDSLPSSARKNILQKLELKVLLRCKVLSKSWKTFIESEALIQVRGELLPPEGSFTAINYYIKRDAWQCSGFDLHSKSWRALPTFSCLPPPDAELFKEYSVCGHGGLICADVSKLPKKGELVVFNPLTGKSKALPPLLYPRNPVLVHISVNSAKKSYKVIVAGSSAASDEHLSKKMEVFDSSTSMWRETCDLPGPVFGLNEHQAGICLDGTLFFISFLEGDGGRGVVAFDVEDEKWLENLVCPIPFSSYSNSLQLVESDGKVCLFSEQERGESVEHCIDVLELANPNAGPVSSNWRNVVRVRKSGRGLLVYPEYTCVGFGAGKLCIFNTLNRDGVVYDMQNGRHVELLEPPPADQTGDNFFSLNPASFTLQPSFDSDPSF